MRRSIFLLLPLALVALSLRAFAADGDSSRPVRSRPPVFPQTLIELFSGDVQTTMTGPVASANSSAQPKDAVPSKLTWSKLIDIDVLEDEIKSYKPLLAADLRTPSVFKAGGYKKCQRDLSMLAVCFAIGAEYDGPFRWKNQAVGARDLFARSGFHCTEPTDAALMECKSRAQDLDALLRADIISVSEAPTMTGDWKAIAERTMLMSRMEQAQARGLTIWTANQGNFTKNTDKIRREAMILAALADVIARSDFEFCDDKVFVGFAQALQKNCLEVLDGVKANNFEQTRKAVGNVTKTCTACHGAYR
jgi:hypothetical protein